MHFIGLLLLLWNFMPKFLVRSIRAPVRPAASLDSESSPGSSPGCVRNNTHWYCLTPINLLFSDNRTYEIQYFIFFFESGAKLMILNTAALKHRCAWLPIEQRPCQKGKYILNQPLWLYYFTGKHGKRKRGEKQKSGKNTLKERGCGYLSTWIFYRYIASGGMARHPVIMFLILQRFPGLPVSLSNSDELVKSPI